MYSKIKHRIYVVAKKVFFTQKIQIIEQQLNPLLHNIEKWPNIL